jgi:transglutaminase-like putative cysteine protease
MAQRIRVEHTSHYRYAQPVLSSFNEARLTPLTTVSQLLLESQLEVSPATPLQTYVDYWGSLVHAFDLHHAHDEFRVVGRSVVETTVPDFPSARLSWADLRHHDITDRFGELLAPTRQVPSDTRLLAVARDLQASHPPIYAGTAALEWVRDQLTYVPGTTGVHTSAVEAWEGGEGVCQDFAHLTLAVLRTMGLPARYCSGYVHPDGDAAVGETVDAESHAWVEAWSGHWQALEPTAGGLAGPQHVLVARGRDYADVPPIKGIFNGGPTDHLDVKVRLTRLA